jgi:hypothetical protein
MNSGLQEPNRDVSEGHRDTDRSIAANKSTESGNLRKAVLDFDWNATVALRINFGIDLIHTCPETVRFGGTYNELVACQIPVRLKYACAEGICKLGNSNWVRRPNNRITLR